MTAPKVRPPEFLEMEEVEYRFKGHWHRGYVVAAHPTLGDMYFCRPRLAFEYQKQVKGNVLVHRDFIKSMEV